MRPTVWILGEANFRLKVVFQLSLRFIVVSTIFIAELAGEVGIENE